MSKETTFIQVVEKFLERGDLDGCPSTHICHIDPDHESNTIACVIKKSIAHTKNGDQIITGELIKAMEKEIETEALGMYYAAEGQPYYDWDVG